MIAGIFHKGSGVGDQLMRYVTTRSIAAHMGVEFGMVDPENFKGESFMQIDKGLHLVKTGEHFFGVDGTFYGRLGYMEKEIRDANGVDIRSYDPEINFLENNTVIDGYFEDFKYWGHKLPAIREWLKTEHREMPDDVCVIGFRGGEFATDPNLFLTREYWQEAISIMLAHNPKIKLFEIHTDDPEGAKKMLDGLMPMASVVHDVGLNWRSVRYAKHLIICNSAFYIIPALMNENLRYPVIAPRYWARRNTKTWARPACFYPQFLYI